MQQYQGQPQGAGPSYAPGSSSGACTEELRTFWAQQRQEVQMVGNDPAEFKNHQLPLARIKKIMKSDEDVRMISAEAPVLFAKACEMFILELTLRSWMHAEDNKRRTLQRSDVAAAVNATEILDFLVDVVPREEGAAAEGAAGGQPGGYAAGGQGLSSVASDGMPHSSVASAPGSAMYPPMFAMGPGGMPGAPGGMYPDPAALAQQQQQQLAGDAPWGAAPGAGLLVGQPGDGEVPAPPAAAAEGAGAAAAAAPGLIGEAVVPQ